MRTQGRFRSVYTEAVVFFSALALLGFLLPVSWVLLLVDIIVSGVAFAAYRADKRAARQGRWRTEERALHLLSLLGGWPGALAAQRTYRHKTHKASFQAIYWVTVAVNVAGSIWLIVASASLSFRF